MDGPYRRAGLFHLALRADLNQVVEIFAAVSPCPSDETHQVSKALEPCHKCAGLTRLQIDYKYQWKHWKRRFNFQGWDQGIVQINAWILGNIHIRHWIKSSCLPSHLCSICICILFVLLFYLYLYLYLFRILNGARQMCLLVSKEVAPIWWETCFCTIDFSSSTSLLEAEQKLGHQ